MPHGEVDWVNKYMYKDQSYCYEVAKEITKYQPERFLNFYLYRNKYTRQVQLRYYLNIPEALDIPLIK